MAKFIEMMHLGPGPNYRPGLGEFVMHRRHVAFVISVGENTLTLSTHDPAHPYVLERIDTHERDRYRRFVPPRHVFNDGAWRHLRPIERGVEGETKWDHIWKKRQGR